eukprot:Clim_evm24s157 gene=Clim_evmTU24s157
MVSNELHQLVDDDYHFQQGLAGKLKDWGIATAGFDYNVMSIVGPQSSGKSTLLNLLFGTEFATMEAFKGRSQTTKGLWISHAPNQPIMVMDVEGTDSRERGEEHINFERKSALFSLAISEVLLLNMWAADIGRHSAANYDVIKIVLDLLLQLFHHKDSPKTMLMFVIRDYTGATPLERLTETLREDMHKIWGELNKPEEYKSSSLTDYFDLEFVGLPHLELQKEEFDKAVKGLSERFSSKRHPKYVFRSEYGKQVPSDGFPMYAEKIWATIMDNKDLDIPSQREMLAMYRCDELAEEAFLEFEQNLTAIKDAIVAFGANKFMPEFGPKANVIFSGALDKYEEMAGRYHLDTATKKKQVLRGRIENILKPLFDEQLNCLRHDMEQEAKADVETALKPAPGQSTVDGFAVKARNVKQKVKQHFTDSASNAVVPGTGWTFDEHLRLLDEFVDRLVKEQRQTTMTANVSKATKSLDAKMGGNVGLALKKKDDDMWESILGAYKAGIVEAETTVSDLCASFEATDAEKEKLMDEVKGHAAKVVGGKVKLATDNLKYSLKELFESKFRRDEHGTPRMWGPNVQVDKHYREAKQYVMGKLGLFEHIPSDVKAVTGDAIEGLDPLGAADLQEYLENEMSASCAQALETQRHNSMETKMPTWAYAVGLLLGANEIYAILVNPVLLVLMLILGGIAFTLHKLGMADQVLKKVQTFANEKVMTTENKERFRTHVVRPIVNVTAPTPDRPRPDRPRRAGAPVPSSLGKKDL